MTGIKDNSLHNHLLALKNGERVYENAFAGRQPHDPGQRDRKGRRQRQNHLRFQYLPRPVKKHVVGMYDEINSFVSYVKDAAEGGSSKEMAYVLVGEPGNGKTFFVEYLSRMYREFLA